MPDKPSAMTLAKIRVLISGRPTVNSYFDLQSGFRQEMSVFGQIDDPYVGTLGDVSGIGGAASIYHQRRFRITFLPVEEINLLNADGVPEGASQPAGHLTLNPSAEPVWHEENGLWFEVESAQAKISLNRADFEALQEQINQSLSRNGIMLLTMNIGGEQLPEPRSAGEQEFGLELKRLESEPRNEYPIDSFELVDTGLIDAVRDRVLQPPKDSSAAKGVKLEVKINKFQYMVDAARARVHSLYCEGMAVRRLSQNLAGLEASVDLEDRNQFQDIEPGTRAYAGDFEFYPKDPDSQHSRPHISLRLWYLRDDLSSLLLPIFDADRSGSVTLHAMLNVDLQELYNAQKLAAGSVKYYGFSVVRGGDND